MKNWQFLLITIILLILTVSTAQASEGINTSYQTCTRFSITPNSADIVNQTMVYIVNNSMLMVDYSKACQDFRIFNTTNSSIPIWFSNCSRGSMFVYFKNTENMTNGSLHKYHFCSNNTADLPLGRCSGGGCNGEVFDYFDDFENGTTTTGYIATAGAAMRVNCTLGGINSSCYLSPQIMTQDARSYTDFGLNATMTHSVILELDYKDDSTITASNPSQQFGFYNYDDSGQSACPTKCWGFRYDSSTFYSLFQVGAPYFYNLQSRTTGTHTVRFTRINVTVGGIDPLYFNNITYDQNFYANYTGVSIKPLIGFRNYFYGTGAAANQSLDYFRFDNIRVWNIQPGPQPIIANEMNLSAGGGEVPPMTTVFYLYAKDITDNAAITNLTTFRLYNSTKMMEINTTDGNVTFYNFTNTTGTLNITTIDYVFKSITNINLTSSTNYTAQMFQSVVYVLGSEAITGKSYSTTYLKINGSKTVYGNNFIYARAGSYNLTVAIGNGSAANITVNLTINKSSNVTINVTVPAIRATIGLTPCGSLGLYDNYSINITVLNNSYNWSIQKLDFGSTQFDPPNGSQSYYTIGLNNNTRYQFNVWSDRYSRGLVTTNITLGAIGVLNITVCGFTTNSINFTIYDEISLNPIQIPVTLEAINNLFGFNDTINSTTGAKTIEMITPGFYLLRFYAQDYPMREYQFNLTNGTNMALSLYLLNGSNVQNVTATLYDEGRRQVSGGTIKVQKRYITDTLYRTVEILKTDYQGQATFRAVLNNPLYRFIIEYNGSTKLVTEEAMIRDTAIEFTIVIGQQVASAFRKSATIDYSLLFDNSTNEFLYTWNDINSYITQACLEITKTSYTGDIPHNQTCQLLTGGSIRLYTPPINGTIYKATASVTYASDGQNYNLATLWKEFLTTSPIGAVSIFLDAFLTIIFACIGIFNPFVALLLLPLPTLLGTIAGLIPLPLIGAVIFAVISWCVALYIAGWT